MPKTTKEILLETLGAMLPDGEKGEISKLARAVDGLESDIRADVQKEVDEAVLREYAEAKELFETLKAEADEKLADAEARAVAGYQEALEMLREAVAMVKERDAKIAAVEADVEAEYGVASEMLKEQREQALQGYAEAAEMLERQRGEFEKQLDENAVIASETIKRVTEERDAAVQDLREVYEQRLSEAREQLVDRVDEFLTEHVTKIEESVRTELASERPETAAISRIREILEECDSTGASSVATVPRPTNRDKRVEMLETENEKLHSQMRLAEARLVRVSSEAARKEQTARALSQSPGTSSRQDALREAFDRAAGKQKQVTGDGVVAESTSVLSKKSDKVTMSDILKEPATSQPVVETDGDSVDLDATICENLNVRDMLALAGIS